ncbi:hypothetical protein [Lederbergia citrea]|uniref:Uncharacterized protein n=1 Tax=Lederbergia citrea TaxID=2833581 RepID=A0A942Z4A8_9BACI|nr:hypothetical protein [Lederbergia citrea]MBS4178033.1 hypothetical protein [Lederbergia citrea]MBS4204699.1 hypothetical protein [Lederbergia citrea]MBS4223454.1 hypothetical protein [Lederbergia citrea]
MKIGLSILGTVIVFAIGYFLYQKQLGAIPFLLCSFVLFYFGYRLLPRSPINKNGHLPEEEELEKSPSIPIDTQKK